MKIGAIIPQGWTGEYDGWDPQRAWKRTVELARQAERLGFESIWVFDHFHTIPQPTDEITFESFTTLSALGMATERVRLGHIVICTGFRNPALTAKMISTLDVITSGRMDLGIGAGWKEDEWVAYGYGFPPAKERLAALEDHLGVIKAMLGPGRAIYQGRLASVSGAYNVPKPIGPVPIMVGGNGPNVTWRLAARFADELNLDGMSPEEVKEALPVVASRCEEAGRDPATLPVSVHMWQQHIARHGQQRVERIAGYRDAGVSRVIGMVRASATDDEALEAFAEDARRAGAELI
jgi:alkanesulfonate monooxygenase SsuD/methylene tetrahydromethanopterin reductase-like flavin-dependent oxidoreductase (luciferase family)